MVFAGALCLAVWRRGVRISVCVRYFLLKAVKNAETCSNSQKPEWSFVIPDHQHKNLRSVWIIHGVNVELKE